MSAVGSWRGTNRLWTTVGEPADESPSTVAVTAVLGGRFVRLDQTWAMQGMAQAGSLLVGHDGSVATAHWMDTFHMGRQAIDCRGRVRVDGMVDVEGTYSAVEGPAWGWRIVIAVAAARSLQIEMFNLPPEGGSELAVRAAHKRE